MFADTVTTAADTDDEAAPEPLLQPPPQSPSPPPVNSTTSVDASHSSSAVSSPAVTDAPHIAVTPASTPPRLSASLSGSVSASHGETVAATPASESSLSTAASTTVINSPGVSPTDTLAGRVSCACSNCKRAKARCDNKRPCERCVRTGKQLSCVDSVHQKRGRKQNRRDEFLTALSSIHHTAGGPGGSVSLPVAFQHVRNASGSGGSFPLSDQQLALMDHKRMRTESMFGGSVSPAMSVGHGSISSQGQPVMAAALPDTAAPLPINTTAPASSIITNTHTNALHQSPMDNGSTMTMMPPMQRALSSPPAYYAPQVYSSGAPGQFAFNVQYSLPFTSQPPPATNSGSESGSAGSKMMPSPHTSVSVTSHNQARSATSMPLNFAVAPQSAHPMANYPMALTHPSPPMTTNSFAPMMVPMHPFHPMMAQPPMMMMHGYPHQHYQQHPVMPPTQQQHPMHSQAMTQSAFQ